MAYAERFEAKLSRLREALRLALVSALREGREQFLRLNQLDADNFVVFSREAHGGDPQDIIDVRVRDAFENTLRRYLPTVRVVGEEAVQTVDLEAYPVAVVDPVDGTKPYRSLGDAWAVAAYISILTASGTEKRPLVPIAAICTASGMLIEAVTENSVYASLVGRSGRNKENQLLTACYPSKQNKFVLACVAAKPKDAERYSRLRTAFPDATIFNVGGNPVVSGVLTGDLHGIVSFHEQAPWDALYALIVQLAGGCVGLVSENRVLEKDELLEYFRWPTMGTASGRKVPPHIASKDKDTYQKILDGLLASSQKKQGEAE